MFLEFHFVAGPFYKNTLILIFTPPEAPGYPWSPGGALDQKVA